MSPFDPWRHRYTVACACATALLVVAGGLVTSTGSGLAVPDWPLSFGTLFPPMTGGVLFEHGHRLVAATVGLLTIVLAIWFGRKETRAWVRRLAYVAIGAVVAQGLLGGLTVLLRLPPSVSVLHACLAQAFFCVVVLLAVATSKRFLAQGREAVPGEARALFVPWAIATGLVYAQLVLGAVMRHTGAGLAIPDAPLVFGGLLPPSWTRAIAVHYAHRILALVVAGAVLHAASRSLRRRRLPGAIPVLAIALLVLQLALGVLTVNTRLAVLPATAHVLVGALLLASCCVLSASAARVAEKHPPLPTPARRRREAVDTAGAARPAGSVA